MPLSETEKVYKECFDSLKEKQLASPERLQEAVIGNLAKKIAGIELGGNQDENFKIKLQNVNKILNQKIFQKK